MNRLAEVFKEIDAINQQDPRMDSDKDIALPKEYLYSLRMTEMLNTYDPSVDELMKIAARGQHIRRWSIPRNEYPMDRKGYLQWRTKLKILHADLLSEIMLKHCYTDEEVKNVTELVTKKKLNINGDAQKLEDVVCLVFLKYYFEDFFKQHPEEKVVDILRKTWRKMTDKGRSMALDLNFSDEAHAIISKALDPNH